MDPAKLIDDPDEIVEYYRQLMVYGDARVDRDGKVIRREEPEYWKLLRVGGRAHGKTAMQRHLERLHEQAQRVIDKTDELHRKAAEWQATPASADPVPIDPGTVRWVCARPTTPVYPPGHAAWHLEKAYAMLRGEITMASIVAEHRAYFGRVEL